MRCRPNCAARATRSLLWRDLHTLARRRITRTTTATRAFLSSSSRSSTRGPAGYDRTHNLQTYWVWDLPFGKDRRWGREGVAAALFGGWQINGVMSLMSGTPIDIIQGNAFNLTAGGSGQYPGSSQAGRRDPRRRRNRQRLLRSQRLCRGEHPGRPAAALWQRRSQPDPRPWILERRPWTVSNRRHQPGENSVPGGGAQRAESPEFREPWRRHLQRWDVRVHHVDDGNWRTELTAGSTRVVLRLTLAIATAVCGQAVIHEIITAATRRGRVSRMAYAQDRPDKLSSCDQRDGPKGQPADRAQPSAASPADVACRPGPPLGPAAQHGLRDRRSADRRRLGDRRRHWTAAARAPPKVPPSQRGTGRNHRRRPETGDDDSGPGKRGRAVRGADVLAHTARAGIVRPRVGTHGCVRSAAQTRGSSARASGSAFPVASTITGGSSSPPTSDGGTWS